MKGRGLRWSGKERNVSRRTQELGAAGPAGSPKGALRSAAEGRGGPEGGGGDQRGRGQVGETAPSAGAGFYPAACLALQVSWRSLSAAARAGDPAGKGGETRSATLRRRGEARVARGGE